MVSHENLTFSLRFQESVNLSQRCSAPSTATGQNSEGSKGGESQVAADSKGKAARRRLGRFWSYFSGPRVAVDPESVTEEPEKTYRAQTAPSTPKRQEKDCGSHNFSPLTVVQP